MEEKKKKRLYCAIYTRKSTAEGLDQDFTSLDAQRESGESYINSQKHEGWTSLNEYYDDGGFTREYRATRPTETSFRYKGTQN